MYGWAGTQRSKKWDEKFLLYFTPRSLNPLMAGLFLLCLCRSWVWSSPWQCSVRQWKWRPSTPSDRPFPSTLWCTWIVIHQRGTAIDPPCSPRSSLPASPPAPPLLSSGCPLCDIRSWMSPVSFLANYQQAQCQCNTWVPMVCSVSKANFCDTFYETVLRTCIKKKTKQNPV